MQESRIKELLESHGYGCYAKSNTNKQYYPKTVVEWCPHCDQEVELRSIFKSQKCPSCGRKIKPCALCDTNKCSCSVCPIGRREVRAKGR